MGRHFDSEQIEAAEEMARYLMEFEHDDFQDTIYNHGAEEARRHIYFRAYVFENGTEAAEKMLAEEVANAAT